MLGPYLTRGRVEEYVALGDTGQPVYVSCEQIIAALKRKSPALADYLAVPKINDQGTAIDWFSPVVGQVLSWDEMSSSQREVATEQLLGFRQQIAQVGQEFASSSRQSSEKTIFSKLLSLSTYCPSRDCLSFIQTPQTIQPVLTFWGFVSNEEDRNKSALYFLERSNKSALAAPIAAPVTPIAADPNTAPVVTQWWMFWRRGLWGCLWMLLLPLLLLLLLGLLNSCLPVAGSLLSFPNWKFKTPSFDMTYKSNIKDGDRVNCAEQVYLEGEAGTFSYEIDFGTKVGIVGIAFDAQNVPDKFDIEWNGEQYSSGYVGEASFDGYLVQAGVDPADIHTDMPSNGLAQLLFDKHSAEPQVATVRVYAPIELSAWAIQGLCASGQAVASPVHQAAITENRAVVDAPAELTPPSVATHAAEALQSKNVGSDELTETATAPSDEAAASWGWAGQEIREEISPASISGQYRAGGLQDKKTGRPLRVEYRIANGKGTLAVKRPDGSSCTGEVVAQKQGEKINIIGEMHASCDDGTKYEVPKTQCKQDGEALVDCIATYGDESIPMLMMKE